MINQNLIKQFMIGLDLEVKKLDIVTNNVNVRIKLMKRIYYFFILFFFFLIKLMRFFLFFIPNPIFYKILFKIMLILPGPFGLFYKLITSYLILEYFE